MVLGFSSIKEGFKVIDDEIDNEDLLLEEEPKTIKKKKIMIPKEEDKEMIKDDDMMLEEEDMDEEDDAMDEEEDMEDEEEPIKKTIKDENLLLRLNTLKKQKARIESKIRDIRKEMAEEDEIDDEEEIYEGFSSTNHITEGFNGSVSIKMNHLKSLLKAILLGLIFYLLTHKDFFEMTKPVFKAVKKVMSHNVLHMLIFVMLSYVVLNISN